MQLYGFSGHLAAQCWGTTMRLIINLIFVCACMYMFVDERCVCEDGGGCTYMHVNVGVGWECL
jgi:hypothetical protein